MSITIIYGRCASSWRRAIAIADGLDPSPAIGPSFALEDYEAAGDRAGIKITLHP